MFLTPDGEPFWGGTYFPPASRWGRPGFPDVLRAIGEAYRDKRDADRHERRRADRRARSASPRRRAAPASRSSSSTAPRCASRRRSTASRAASAARPNSRKCRCSTLLWRGGTPAQGRRARAMRCWLTLDHIAQGGIYDHLGGGFARYSIDARWLVPHFEKMLYDNALLVELLTSAWQETRAPLYAARVAETIALGGARDAPSRTAASPRASMPTASTRKASSMSGARPRSTASSAPRAARFKECLRCRARRQLGRARRSSTASAISALGDPSAEARARRVPRGAAPGARGAGPARLRRQGAGRLERADDRGAGRCGCWRSSAPDWLGARARGVRLHRAQRSARGDGRLAHAWRAGKRAHTRRARRLRQHEPRRAGALRGDRAAGLSRGGARAGSRSATGITAIRAGGGYFFTADDAEALLVRTKQALDQPNPSGNGTHRRGAGAALSPDRRGRVPHARAEACSPPSPARRSATSSASRPCSTAPSCCARALQIVVIGAGASPGDAGAAPRHPPAQPADAWC